MITRDEAINMLSDVEKFYCESVDEYGYYCYEAEDVLNTLYDMFEKELKQAYLDGSRDCYKTLLKVMQ